MQILASQKTPRRQRCSEEHDSTTSASQCIDELHALPIQRTAGRLNFWIHILCMASVFRFCVGGFHVATNLGENVIFLIKRLHSMLMLPQMAWY